MTKTNRLADQPNAASLAVNLEGCLLVAAPQRKSEPFARAVCLVVHHSEDGAVGIVLNKSLDQKAAGLWQQLAGNSQEFRKGLLHFGGPKSGPVVALHNCERLAEYTSADGVYFAAQAQTLKELVKSESDQCDVKILVGQADWKAGELEDEFEAGKWLPLPVSPKLVFADEHQMWVQAMREVGNQVISSMTHAPMPVDVLMN